MCKGLESGGLRIALNGLTKQAKSLRQRSRMQNDAKPELLVSQSTNQRAQSHTLFSNCEAVVVWQEV
jgi:hypothetical protein